MLIPQVMLAKALLYTYIYIYVHTVFCIQYNFQKLSYVMSLPTSYWNASPH